ncbi:uncharacterized protein TRAVEDRAFT_60534 [Trametes versicolor FP-101664 SS1]|uniref:uncharacterized protein n=1 Tax=Trametes versicolor (strain FP-101664) TaxID=717944 RepID=UPI0004623564|nr:uncharacterized protein TRAVEDRAFT_60534 [Trametes versicolor FP-101664 SS1]EIW53949.1 hypothetical protein TRAVEDRAFT_60534 [Trametes versicolor FP-101664 SS1]
MHATSSNHLLRSFISSPARCVRSVPSLAWRQSSSQAAAPVSSLSSARPPSYRAGHAPRRTFVSTSSARAVHAQQPPAHRAELVSYPSPSSLQQEDADEDEPDVEFIPPEEAALELTDRAAERLRDVAQREGNTAAALRIAVESGGCHGYQYKIDLAKSKELDDYHFSHPRIKPSNVYVDAVSMTLLKGSTIDFATELIGSSFRVVDNPQAKGNGCGCGVSWELNL